MLTIVFLFVCYVSVFIITVLLCLLLLCMLFLICMVLNICNFIQRTEQVPVELDISAIEEYILLLLLIKALTATAWRKQKDTLIAIYKAGIRPSLEYACCCLPSETYGRNGATPIFRSFFHRTASSTTGGWSRWNI